MDDFRQMISLDDLTSDATITLARTAAEAIRGLNWTTNCGAGLDQPAVAYDVLGALSQAAGRLGQLTAQITRYLDQALAAGKLGHDRGEDPALAVDERRDLPRRRPPLRRRPGRRPGRRPAAARPRQRRGHRTPPKDQP